MASNPISLILYQNLAKFACRFLKSDHVDVWIRNSLYFQNITFLKSDIDFSILVKNNSPSNCERSLQRYMKLKMLCPILGEVNIYREDFLEFMSLHNRYELARDPFLLNYAIQNNIFKKLSSEQDRQNQSSEQIVFITRMAMANIKDLKNGIYNKKKWHFYFSHAGLPYISSIPDLMTYLEISSFENIPLHLDPIAGLKTALLNNAMENLLNDINELSLLKKNVLTENLMWEYFGVLGQYYQTENKKQILDHFNNIHQLLLNINSYEKSDLNLHLVPKLLSLLIK